ncbi:tryptophan 2,3-dioxygenase [Plantactinospora sp. DSM 117369]
MNDAVSQPGRRWQRLTEEERVARVTKGPESVVVDSAGNPNPYSAYQNLGTLLSLQNVRTTAAEELPFYIVTQVKELLFKLLATEVRRARDDLFGDDLPQAIRILSRVSREQRLLTECWHVLSDISPTEFVKFRDELGPASGLQSYTYRQLEFVLGRKVKAVIRPHANDAEVYRSLEKALSEPSLYDAALHALRRARLPVPDDVLDRDLSEPYEPSEAVVEAWHHVYLDQGAHRQMYLLAETLMEVAYEFSRWRAVHLLVVERILGAKPGSGGSSGVGWLSKTAAHRFFPELWTVRDRI